MQIKKWGLILIGSVIWSLTMVKSGWIYSYGMGFWGANGHDGIWHVALIESLSKGKIGMPVFAGYMLQNYHIGFDLIIAFLHLLTRISVINLYFQIVPPIIAVLIGVTTYNFVFAWKKSRNAALWSTFFSYFGGSLGFLVGRGESAFWAQQGISTLINPPFALSIVIILLGLIFLLKYLEKSQLLYFILTIISLGLLIEIKAYAGILALGALLIISLVRYLKTRKYDIFLIFCASLLVSILVYLPLNKNSQGLIIFQPFWFLETMMGLSDRLGWVKFYSAMTTYRLGHVWLKMIPSYLVAFTIFYIGNMGTRMLKEFLIFRWIKSLRSIGMIESFISTMILSGLIIPTFFLQKGTPWNTIQFFYYSLFFSGILAGVSIADIVRKTKLHGTPLLLVYVSIAILTIPTTILTLWEVYIPNRPPAKISSEELDALAFLKRQPDGIVLTYPFSEQLAKAAEANPPRPLYLYDSTAYVSALSAHPTFLEDTVNLDITGFNWKDRLNGLNGWYQQTDQSKARKFLATNNIKYIYWVKPQRAILGEGNLHLSNIFENKEVVIYEVD